MVSRSETSDLVGAACEGLCTGPYTTEAQGEKLGSSETVQVRNTDTAIGHAKQPSKVKSQRFYLLPGGTNRSLKRF